MQFKSIWAEHHATHNINHILCIHQTASVNYHFNVFKIILEVNFILVLMLNYVSCLLTHHSPKDSEPSFLKTSHENVPHQL
jgi:hypothetical protein